MNVPFAIIIAGALVACAMVVQPNIDKEQRGRFAPSPTKWSMVIDTRTGCIYDPPTQRRWCP